MQNPIQTFRQSSIVFEKPRILSENLKTLTSSNYPKLQYFFLQLRTRFLLTNVYERVRGIFLIFFRFWVSCKNQKRPGFYTLVFCTFINNSRSKQNKNIPHTVLYILLSRKCVQISTKNIKLYGSWSSSKFSIFQTKNLVSWK